MYYKVIKNDRVIDVLDRMIYVRYQPKHKVMMLCSESDAQAILSSDGEYIWHETGLLSVPVDGYDTVTAIRIDEYEYKQLKALNFKTPEEIIDAYTLALLESGVI